MERGHPSTRLPKWPLRPRIVAAIIEEGRSAMAHPNEQRLRDGFEAFSKGDLDTLRNEYLAPDIVWHSPGRNQLAGEYKGIDQVMGLFGRLFEMTGGTFRQELHDVLANNEHGVTLAIASAERQGKTLRSNGVLVFNLDKDGKVTEAWLHPEDQYAVDEFFS
jgi:ketosteroid isomerase-like protein